MLDPVEVHRLGVTVRGIQDVQLKDRDLKRLTAQAHAEGAAGYLDPVVGQTFLLTRAADAQAAIEGREVFGKTVLLT